MRIVYITAGAGGMYCGNCLRDNTLAATLIRQGHDVTLVPLYTPIRTDETDVSLDQVFYGGLNVYLQQRLSLFRHTPRLLDGVLDAPGLLRWISRFAIDTDPHLLGALTLSVLEGEEGRQQKELRRLIEWLGRKPQPQLVHLTNSLLTGLARKIKSSLNVPVLCALQGEDVFLEGLPEPYRGKALEVLQTRAADIDAFIAPSRTYADRMAGFLDVPRKRIHVVYPGLELDGHGGAKANPGDDFTIGYMARIGPDKGLHTLVDAFRILRQSENSARCRLRVAGYLGKENLSYLEKLQARIREWGLAEDFEYIGSIDRKRKIDFIQGLDALSVPTVYAAPKGLYVLEAWANGVPVVEPRHGSFPEFIETSGGGLLFEPGNAEDLAAGLRRLIEDRAYAAELGQKGRAAVQKVFNAETMARETAAIYSQYIS